MLTDLMSNGRYTYREGAGVAVLVTAVWGVYLTLVPLQPDIPLNDDWAYAQSVRHLLETGDLRVTEWTTAALVPQIYWGALFARIAGGFSFAALHWSTVVFGVIGCLALYDLLRQLDTQRSLALLGVFALIVNPLFVNLTYTFMTDVFYLGLMLLSLTLYARGIKAQSCKWLLAGSVLAAVAYLERQLGVVLPIAVAGAIVIHERRWPWRRLLAIGLAPVLTVVAHQLWLRYVTGMPWAMELVAVNGGLSFFRQPNVGWTIALRAAWSLLYLGLFTLPVSIARLMSGALSHDLRRWLKWFGVWLVALTILVIVVAAVTGQSMPFLANIINRNGLGALTLAGERDVGLPAGLFWLITFLSPIAGAAQAAWWTGALIDRRALDGPQTALGLAGIGTAILSVVFVVFWDRYLLALMPMALVVSGRSAGLKRAGWIAGLMACGVMATYSLAGMNDYLAWNTARWAAGRQLVAQGVSPTALAGGIEWVGWYEFETALPWARAAGKGNELFGWTQMTPKKYQLAFTPLAGYQVIGAVAYSRWLSAQPDHIYILRRE